MADLTSSQVAERLNVAHSTVRAWCNKGVFTNARSITTPAGSYWLIPESDLDGFEPPKMGRPPKPKEEKEAGQGSKKKGGSVRYK